MESTGILEKINATVLLYAYSILLGALYLFAFWRPFGFSIFPYLALQDYISAPLNQLVVLIAFPFLLIPLTLLPMKLEGFFKIFIVGLLVSYGALSLYYLIQGVQLLLQHSFHYRNESNVLFFSAFLTFSSLVIATQARGSPHAAKILILAVALAQSSTVVAAGYKDGKILFNGAAEVHFLDNREVCEKEGRERWVFLARFSNSSIFIHAIDKRLCITEEKNYRLVSRKIIENL